MQSARHTTVLLKKWVAVPRKGHGAALLHSHEMLLFNEIVCDSFRLSVNQYLEGRGIFFQIRGESLESVALEGARAPSYSRDVTANDQSQRSHSRMFVDFAFRLTYNDSVLPTNFEFAFIIV